jgi:Na+-translocating ferredoxin:NAD+ oxidoreductase subunit B
MHWGMQFMRQGPHMMQVVPIEKQIPVKQEALTYQQASGLIERAESFRVNECMCKKKERLLDNPCSKPTEVCLAMDSVPGALEKYTWWGGKVITREEAYEVLRKAEEAGLVHLTSNIESGHWFICNCCGCCCGPLRATIMGATNFVNSHYYAEIDPELCSACGICADERCQVNAIEKGEEFSSVITAKCIGCGLCASTCPTEAITMVHKKPEDRGYIPKDEDSWFEERGRQRGVDFSEYK